MKNKGKADITIYGTGNILKHLTKHADLDNPQAVEAFMATKQTNAYKDHLATAYADTVNTIKSTGKCQHTTKKKKCQSYPPKNN